MSRVLECADCGGRTFYEKRRCADCGAETFRDRDPGVGTLQAVTAVHVTPDDVSEPNRLGLASFDGDASVIAQCNGTLEAGDVVAIAEGASRDGEDSTMTLVPAAVNDRR
ncbi:hypothetical protein [Natrialba taiwanensis]|uniref:DUF35 domain-containing protein n=1 Tax=Natrialba taiwanensis DSM 12281 TaxID=1230458 RepID=M0ACK3_9EURY|nr:hypothetical protein [Natrialba taiwanensis]ELY96269.1 hypothetical protein C484_01105 [Natrialba taiwanensis DSM 12281]